MINLEGMSTKNRMELEDMSYLYGNVQDLHQFKDNYDELLLNKCQRNTMGKIYGYFNWCAVSEYMINELKKKAPSIGDSFSIDSRSLAALADENNFTVYCGYVSHAASTESPYWQLSYDEGEMNPFNQL